MISQAVVVGLLVFLSLHASHINAATVKDTSFNPKRGFFQSPFTLTISSDTAGATIVYTLDNSDPRSSPLARKVKAPLVLTVDPASSFSGLRPRPTSVVSVRAYAEVSMHALLCETHIDVCSLMY
jgi:hypothetical protein